MRLLVKLSWVICNFIVLADLNEQVEQASFTYIFFS